MMKKDRAHDLSRWIGPGANGGANGGAVGVGVGLIVLLALVALSAGSVMAQGSTPTPAGTVVFADDFEGGTLDRWLFADPQAATLVSDGGNRVLRLNRADGMSIALPVMDVTWTDFVVEASVQIVRAVGSNSAGDVFLDVRSNFADAGYSSYSGYISATNDRAGIGVIIEDTWIDVLSGATFQINIAAGQWYTLRAEARGERIEWYVNDRLASWVVDRQIERGSFAFFVPPGAEVYVDNVRVIDLTGAAGGSTGFLSGLGRTPGAPTATPTPSATATPSATPTGTDEGASATGTKETTSSGGSLFGGLGGAGTPATPAVALASTTATATPTPTVAAEVNCTVEPLSQNVSLRHGPGTNYAREGTLDAGQSARVNGQAIGTDGLVWWRLTDDS